MAEMTPEERGQALADTLLSDIEKLPNTCLTPDIRTAARWLANNAAKAIRAAVAAERGERNNE